MSEAFHNDPIDAELQVRLMNLVMGEASDFERDQLQLLMEQRPELAAYMQHLEHLHGLLCVVGTDDASIDVDASTADETWQLPTDRREKLLAFLDGKDSIASPLSITSLGPMSKRRIQRSRWYVAALVVAAAASLLVGLMLPSVQSARPAARMSGSTPEAYYLNDEAQYFSNELGSKAAQAGGEDNFRAQFALADAVQSAQTVRNFASNNNAPAKAVARAKVPQPSASIAAEGDSVASVPSDGTILLGGISRTAGGEPERTVGTDWNSRKETSSPQLAMPRILIQAEEEPVSGRVVDSRELEAAERKLKTSQNFGTNPSQDEAPHIQASPPDQVLANNAEYFVKPADGVEPADKLRLRQWDDRVDGFKESGLNQQIDQPVDQKNGLAVPADRAKGLGVPSQPSAGTSLFGDVQTDFIEDLDLVNIKELDGKKLKAAIDTRKKDAESAGKTNKQDAKPQESADDPKTSVDKKELGQNTDKVKDSGAAQVGQDGGSKQILEALGEVASAVPTPYDRVLGKDLKTTSDRGEPAVTLYDSTASMRYSRRGTDLGWKYTPAPSPEITSSYLGRVNLERKPGATNPSELLDEQTATTDAFSTFSLHVSDVSFKLAQAALAQGQWPEAAKIRIEEFVNALDYHDPLPHEQEKVACRVEQAIHPFLMQRNLLRVSMRTAATGRSQNTPLRLTLLLDNSGSMERPDRRQAVVRAFQTLTAQLSANDQVTLISFASTPRLLADKVPGNQGETLLKLIENLPSEGGTNIEAALLLAREKALEQQLAGAQNRIVLLTDGAVNLGNANPEALSKLVTQLRDSGIAFDAAGISALDLNDEVLEALTRQGDGRYYLLDSAQSVGESFAMQIAGALRPSAQNVKVQVEFNPERVGRYKLLGFDKHRLNKEDFRNDQVDAAEMAAAEAGVAMYQYEIKPNGSGDVGNVSVRFRDLSTGQMIERRWPIPYESGTPRLEQAQPSMQLAAAAALLAAKLSGGPLADSVDLAQLQKLLANLSEEYAGQPRVQQLRAMIDQASTLSLRR